MEARLTTVLLVAAVAGRLGAQDTAATPAAARPSPAPTVQIDGLLQIWYLDGHTITNPHDTYRIRRADIKLSGVISPRVRWRVSLDGAKLLNLTMTVRSEIMGARDGTARRLGYYTLGTARPTPDVELVARWDSWDPDLHNETGALNAAEHEVVAGASYFIEGGATRLAANVARSTFPSGKVPSSTMLLLALQVLW